MSRPSKHTHPGDGTVPGLHGEPIPTPVLGCPACVTVSSIGDQLGAAPERRRMSGNPEGMAWEAVQRDGDAVLPDGWAELTSSERDAFRDELEEWMSKAKAQPNLFADQGARAARLHQMTAPPNGAVGWEWVEP